MALNQLAASVSLEVNGNTCSGMKLDGMPLVSDRHSQVRVRSTWSPASQGDGRSSGCKRPYGLARTYPGQLWSPVRAYDPRSAAPGGSPLVLRHRFLSQRRARKSTKPAVGSANTT